MLSLFCFYRTVHQYAALSQRSVFSVIEVPEYAVAQVTILKYFAHYMEENLMDVSVLLVSTLMFVFSFKIVTGLEVKDLTFWSRLQVVQEVVVLIYCLSLFFMQGGDMISEQDTQKTRIYLLQWLKSDRALLMLFNDGTFQVKLQSSLFFTKQLLN